MGVMRRSVSANDEDDEEDQYRQRDDGAMESSSALQRVSPDSDLSFFHSLL